MKVWRGLTLALWVALLATCAAFILLYHALGTTVLDVRNTKGLLVESKTYETIRDTVLVDLVMAEVTEQYPENKLIDKAMVSDTLKATLPAEILAARFDPAITNVYRWLDSKEEDITFSIAIVDKKDSFYRALEERLAAKLTSLDSCGDYRYPPEEAVLEDLCLPVYLSAKEATQAAMGSIRAGDFPLGDTITQDTLLGAKADRGSFTELPTYLNILWTLNLLAIAVFAVTALFLAISRKSLGFIALGISLIIGGIATWLIAPAITTFATTATRTSPLEQVITEALVTPFAGASTNAALLTILSGMAVTALAFIWRWQRGRHA